jgi:hypothetical protein
VPAEPQHAANAQDHAPAAPYASPHEPIAPYESAHLPQVDHPQPVAPAENREQGAAGYGARIAADVVANENLHLALVPPNPAANPVVPSIVAPAGAAGAHPLTQAEAVRALIGRDAEMRTLPVETSPYDALTRTQIDRNIAEIVAFTDQPEFAASRPELLRQLKRSIAGPEPRPDGLKLFPLLPMYVGENVRGFQNWYDRGDPPPLPGEVYEAQKNVPLSNRRQIQAVEYFNADQQANARVYVSPDKQLMTARGPLGDGKWIFVVNANGEMIADRPVPSVVHHSSLAGGEPVLMAGQIEITGGVLTRIDNQSGHFRPDVPAFKAFLAALSDQGVELGNVIAESINVRQTANVRFQAIGSNDNLLDAPDVVFAPENDMLVSMRVPPGGVTLRNVAPPQSARRVKTRPGVSAAPSVPAPGAGQPDQKEPYQSEGEQQPRPRAPAPQSPPTTWRGPMRSGAFARLELSIDEEPRLRLAA